MPRIARLHFADGHTDETVIDDPRTLRICRDGRYFIQAAHGSDEPLTYLEEPTPEHPGAVLPPTTTHATPANTRPDGGETLVPGPGGFPTPDW